MSTFYIFSFTYLFFSILTFIVYFIDKRAAIKNKYRISENTLHLLSFLGGWPGALLAQNILRHKSVKQPFKVILWITIFLNCILFLYFIIPNSSIYLDKIL